MFPLRSPLGKLTFLHSWEPRRKELIGRSALRRRAIVIRFRQNSNGYFGDTAP